MLSVSSKPIKKLMFAHMLSASSYQIWKLVSPFSYMLSVSNYPIKEASVSLFVYAFCK